MNDTEVTKLETYDDIKNEFTSIHKSKPSLTAMREELENHIKEEQEYYSYLIAEMNQFKHKTISTRL